MKSNMRKYTLVEVGRPDDPNTQKTIAEMEEQGFEPFKIEPSGKDRNLAYFRKKAGAKAFTL